MNASCTNFQDKYRRAYRGEWLYSFGSIPSPRRCAQQDAGLGRFGTDSAEGWGTPGSAALRGGWFGEMGSRGAGWGGGAVLCARSRRRGSRGGSWPPSWRRRFLLELPSHLGIWEFSSVYLFMWEKGSMRSLSYTCLCKNAKGRVVFFISILFFTEEGVVIVS